MQFCRELDRARAADLVERVKASALAAAAERSRQHLCRLPELWRAQVVRRGAEVGVVEDVEEISSSLEREPIEKVELPTKRQVELRSAESAQGVASQVALHRRGGDAERCRIDDLSTWCV